MVLSERRRLRLSILGMALATLTLVLSSCGKPERQAGGLERLEKKDMIAGDTILANSTKESLDNALGAVHMERATFSLGWFWGPDARFGQLKGVIHTRVGYAGGTRKDPTYESLGDHSETIEVTYDPQRISFAELLDIFWQSHEPTVQSSYRQYMSIIFYHDEEQRKLAMMTKDRQEASRKRKIQTIIVPAGIFYPAEDYHQKYYLRSTPSVMKELNALYPTSTDFINSTAAAKVNGFLGGNGTIGDLKADLESIKLAPEMVDRIIRELRRVKG